MPPAAEDDDNYNSASDSDFNDAELSASSAAEDESDEAEVVKAKGRRGKKSKKDDDGDVEMASGDEGIVAEGRRKKKKPKGKGKSKGKIKGKGKKENGDQEEQDANEEDDDDDAPVGVRVRLRSGRGGQEVKKAALPTTSAADADIDAIWARMNNPSAFDQSQLSIDPTDEEKEAENPSTTQNNQAPLPTPHPSTEATIPIPHTYKFAGQTHTSTKTVPISSPAARAYLSSLENTKNSQTVSAAEAASSTSGPTLRRPLARKGLMEPNPTGLLTNRGTTFLPRTDLPASIGGNRVSTTKAASPSAAAKKPGFGRGKENSTKLLEKNEKLNTVEKSKLDWEAEVERLGIRAELEKAEKSGGSYLGRVEFLRRVEGGEEERARMARLKTRGLM